MSEIRQVLKEQLISSINDLLRRSGFEKLVPEVGSNFVACLPGATKLSQVAGLTGRIILVRGKPKAVGEVDFGWAPYMGRVILLAHRLDKSIQSSISLRYSRQIEEAGRDANLQVVGFRLPENQPVPDCMTLEALKKLNFVPEVLFDRGAHGIEPLVVVFGSTPEETKDRVQAIIRELLASK